MSWTAPKTWTAEDVLVAEDLNVYLRDNMNEMAPAKAKTLSALFVTSDVNQIDEKIAASDFINTLESTDSTAFTDLGTVGPKVTVNVSSSTALVFLYCHMYNSGVSGSYMGVEVSGATDVAASISFSLELAATGGQRAGIALMLQNLNPGLNTFTAKYQALTSHTASFSDRRIAVLPF